MRNALVLGLVVVLVSGIETSSVLGQSGSRGSGSRVAPRAGGGYPSRVGGARSKAIVGGGRPTGLINSANAARASGGARPTTGLPSRSSFAPSPRSYSGGSGTTGLSSGLPRPSRKSGASSRIMPSGPRVVIPEGFRTWTDSTGKYSIAGKLLGSQNGSVWIRRTDGKIAKLQISQLSGPDQAFVTDSTSPFTAG